MGEGLDIGISQTGRTTTLTLVPRHSLGIETMSQAEFLLGMADLVGGLRGMIEGTGISVTHYLKALPPEHFPDPHRVRTPR